MPGVLSVGSSTGLEPATSKVTVLRSNQLSYEEHIDFDEAQKVGSRCSASSRWGCERIDRALAADAGNLTDHVAGVDQHMGLRHG